MGITTVTLGLAGLGVTAQAATGDNAATQTTVISKTGDAENDMPLTNGQTTSINAPAATTSEQTPVTETTPVANTAQTTQATTQTPESVPVSDATPTTQSDSATTETVDSATTTTTDATASQITSVGDVDDATYNDIKTAAAEAYQTTGTPQVITRVAAATAVTPQTGTYGTATWDLAEDGALTIHAGTMTDKAPWLPYADQITSITTEAGVVADSSTNNDNYNIHLFGDLPNVTTIDLTGMDTSQMTSMSHMFASDPKLTSITVDPTLFNTSKVTDMSRMFWGDGALVDIDLTPFDTSSVTNFYGMFESLGAIKSLDVSGFDTSQATNMQQMFYGTSSLENLDVSNFDTSKVTNMNSMFEDAGNRNAKLVLNVSDFDVAQVTDFGSMFFGSGIQILNVKYWQMSPDANTSSWLGQMDNLWQLTVGQHVKLTDAKLPDVPEAGTPIPPHTSDQLGNPNLVSGIEQDGQFVTGWEMISSGTITDPEGPVWSTTQLMDLYKGNGIGAPMTYVWSQPVLNFYQPIDVATGQMVPDSETVILDTYGALVDVNLDDLAVNGVIPDGYHAATGTELGSYKQPREGVGISTNGTRFKIYVAADAVPITTGEMTVSRTIAFTSDNPNADLPATVVQQVVYRTATDPTTNQTGYTPTGIFAEYDVPTLAGYTADTQTVAASVPAGTFTAPQDSVVTVNYTAHPMVYGTDTAMRRITFGSEDPKAKVPGNVIQTVTYKTATDTVTGKTVYTPMGVLPEYEVPELSGYTPSVTTVKQITLVPSFNSPELWIDAVSYSPNPVTYGTATSTRTITFTSDNPNAELPNDVTQTITYRTTTDKLTGKTVYTPAGAYAGYEVPELTGYVADQTSVAQLAPGATVTEPTDKVVTVNYTADPVTYGTATATRTITFTSDNPNAELPTTVVQTVPYRTTTDPVTGETVYTPTGAYAGYEVPELAGYVADQTSVAQVAPGATTTAPADSTVTVNYTANPVTHGITTATRTITFTSDNPNADLPNDVTQTVTYRTTTDKLTGKTVYTPAGAYADYDVPELSGYVADQTSVTQLAPGATTTAPMDSVVTINYTANPVTHGTTTATRTITFTSDNPNADLPTDVTQTVTYRTATDTVTGKVVYTPTGVYAGYEVPELTGYTADQTAVPQATPKATVTTPTDAKVTVTYTASPLDHGTATVTRTITFVDQGTGKTLAPPIVQTVPYKTVTDPATGETAYTPVGLYATYDVPTINGYETSQTVVPQVVPGTTMTTPADSVVEVDYKRVVTETTPTETNEATVPPTTEVTTLTDTPTTASPVTENTTAVPETTPSETAVPTTNQETMTTSDNSTAPAETQPATLAAESANSQSVADETVTTPSTAAKATTAGNEAVPTAVQAQLPQTGDQQSAKGWVAVGLTALLAELGMALGFGKKNRQH